jgi:hypothetical protein
MRMMKHEPAREPSLEEPPEQPMLPFEQSAPTNGNDEPTEPEIKPREVWKALPAAMRVEVRRYCLRTMREVIGDAPE